MTTICLDLDAIIWNYPCKGNEVRIFDPNPGADPGFFLGGGALVSRSTSTPINHIVFFAEYQLY